MANSPVPELRAQLSDAQKILQTGAAAANGQPITIGTVAADGPSRSRTDRTITVGAPWSDEKDGQAPVALGLWCDPKGTSPLHSRSDPKVTVIRRPAMRPWLLAILLSTAAPSGAPAQDAANGEKVFAQCRACHQLGETAKNAVGPVLNGLFGRKAGTVEGYNYSPANKNSGLTWDEATFSEYIKDPRAKVPGTKMVYAGLKDEQRIKDLIAYLKQFDVTGKKTADAPGGTRLARY